MAKEKVKNDASSSIEGTLYQFYVAIEKCFEMSEGDMVIIEKHGDISIADRQIEVKKYSDDLTDSHENIWNTLKNWMDDKFDHSKYKYLILLTTQELGSRSQFQNWNAKTVEGRIDSLKKIMEASENRLEIKSEKEKESKPSDALLLMRGVLNESHAAKLKGVLSKFIILDSSLLPVEYYENIKEERLKFLNKHSHERVLNALLGFILSPSTVILNGWQISYDDFQRECEDLNERYAVKTKIFPSVEHDFKETDRIGYEASLFVTKIKDIDLATEVDTAITQYCVRQKVVTEELSRRISMRAQLNDFDRDLIDKYGPRYTRACLTTNVTELIKHSKIFYLEMMSDSVAPLSNFTNTTIAFRNGTLHELANDPTRQVVWKLKCSEE
jgi:hypothetical protein